MKFRRVKGRTVEKDSDLAIALKMLLDQHAARELGASQFKNYFHIETPAQAARFGCAVGDRSPVLVVVATAPEIVRRLEAVIGELAQPEPRPQ